MSSGEKPGLTRPTLLVSCPAMRNLALILSILTGVSLLACEKTPEPSALATKTPEAKKKDASEDPAGGRFTLAQALEGIQGSGKLMAKLETNQGVMVAWLFEEQTPITIANMRGPKIAAKRENTPKRPKNSPDLCLGIIVANKERLSA